MRMKKILMMMLAGGLLLSCTELPPTDDPIPEVTDNELVPIELPAATRGFVSGGNDFSFRLLQQVEKGTEDSFLISSATFSSLFRCCVQTSFRGGNSDEKIKPYI